MKIFTFFLHVPDGLPSKEMTKFRVGVALNGNSAKCPMAMVALLGKLTFKKKQKPTQSINQSINR
jgi:hypothetical protein